MWRAVSLATLVLSLFSAASMVSLSRYQARTWPPSLSVSTFSLVFRSISLVNATLSKRCCETAQGSEPYQFPSIALFLWYDGQTDF